MKTVITTTPRWALALSLVALLASPACLPEGGVDWPSIVNCGPGVDDLLPTVSRLLLDGGAQADPQRLAAAAASELEKLAKRHGPEAIACLVDLLVSDWFAAGATREANGYEPDPARYLGAMRGQAFLRDAGVEVRR